MDIVGVSSITVGGEHVIARRPSIDVAQQRTLASSSIPNQTVFSALDSVANRVRSTTDPFPSQRVDFADADIPKVYCSCWLNKSQIVCLGANKQHPILPGDLARYIEDAYMEHSTGVAQRKYMFLLWGWNNWTQVIPAYPRVRCLSSASPSPQEVHSNAAPRQRKCTSSHLLPHLTTAWLLHSSRHSDLHSIFSSNAFLRA